MSDTSASDLSGTLVANPLHEQVRERITGLIADGSWPEGHVLPAEADLARMLGVSEGTIRRAMQALTQEGLLMRRRRTGTVVTGRAPQHTLDRWYKYYRLHTHDCGLVNTETRVLDVGRRAPTDMEVRQLKLPERTKVGTVTRLRLYDGRPVMIDRVVLPLHRLAEFPNDPADMPPLIFKWLLERHGLRLGALRERVTARVAETEDLRLLDLPGDVPVALLEIDEIAFDPQNEPILLMRHSALTDMHCYVNELR